LFIDEIGELHSTQMNKLLKVLEDRKVFMESAYYSQEDRNIPQHIHEIFQRGLPADFRLIGATTRMPEDIPPAIRSRCLEVFFRGLLPEEISQIAANAASRIGFIVEGQALEVIMKYATNGREAVNTVQVAAGIALCEQNKRRLTAADVEWVVNASRMSLRPEKKIPLHPQVGYVNGLAVYGPSMGMLLEIEVAAHRATLGQGRLMITGAVDEEEMGGPHRVIRRKSMARGSVENVLTVLQGHMDVNPRDFDIHVNFPGSAPVDGPSAGIAVATAIYSALNATPVLNTVAMTGEISVRGFVCPVGGVACKVEAARQAGVRRIIIPKDNWQQAFSKLTDIEVVPVETLREVLGLALVKGGKGTPPCPSKTLAASSR